MANHRTRGSGPKTKEQKRKEAEERAALRKKKIKKSGSRAGGLNDYQLKIEYSKVETEVEKSETIVAELEAQLGRPFPFRRPCTRKNIDDEIRSSPESPRRAYKGLGETR